MRPQQRTRFGWVSLEQESHLDTLVRRIANPNRGIRWSRTEGQVEHDRSTKDMVFDVAALLQDVSRYLALEPGDVVLTGTPEGVTLSGRFPYLAPGDVVEMEIDGLGTARHTIAGGAA